MMKQGQCKIELNSANGTHFGRHQSLVSVDLLKVKKYPQTRKIVKVFESDN